MNLAKTAFRAMVVGFKKKRLREYYDELSKNKEGGAQLNPIIVREQMGGGGGGQIVFSPNITSGTPQNVVVNPQSPQVVVVPVPYGSGGGFGRGGAGWGGGPGGGGGGDQTSYQYKPEITQNLFGQKVAEELGGYDIPELGKYPKMAKSKTEMKPLKQIVYPLIPAKPAPNEPIFAYAKIFWDGKLNKYVYQVVEPEMTGEIKSTLERLKELLEERLDVDFSKLKISEATDYLRSEIDKVILYYKIVINENDRKILQYFIERDFMGLGKIEPFMHDINIEDISCDGIGIPIFIFHRNPEIGSVPTNVIFNDGEELDGFITRLSQLSGKSISVAEPLLDGALPDGSRLQATLATDIARKGSNFTIRKFSEEPLTPIHLLKYGTVDVKTMAYLWMAVDFGRSILVSGGTASGKTSFLNALSLFIRPDKKIISIEDTAELRLPHPHWVPTVARTSIASESKGEIDMFALLKESLRQRPDYIIVGEVRGQEAFVLFQQMATGHPSYATIHAENMDKLVSRLTTAPISLPKALIGSLDLTVFLMRMRYREKFVRRTSEVVEMIEFDPNRAKPTVNNVFKWNPITDEIEVVGKSLLLKKISDLTGLTQQDVIDELKRRILVLVWLRDRNITNYNDFYKIINIFYNYPNRLLQAIEGGA